MIPFPIRNLIFLLVSLTSSIVASASAKNVVVWDSYIGEPLTGVDIIAFDSNKNIHFKGKTGNNGSVTIHNLELSDTVEFSFIGFHPLRVETSLLPDTIFMKYALNELGEVTVRAERQLVKLQGNKLTYDVGNDIDLQKRSALEALMRTPMLIRTGKESVEPMSGYVGIEYRMNGLRDRMLSDNMAAYLSTIEAQNIKSIEVSTIPTADGTKLLVNIVTKGRIEGIRGTLDSSLDQDSWFNRLTGISKIKRFAFSASYSNIWNFERSSSSYSLSTRYDQPDVYQMERATYSRGYRSDLHRFMLDASYDISDNTLISISGSVLAKTDPHSSSCYNGSVTTESGLKAITYKANLKNDIERDKEYNASAYFQSKLKKGYLFAEYQFYHRPFLTWLITDYDLEFSPEAEPERYYGLFSDTRRQESYRYTTHSAQVEWRRWFIAPDKDNFKLDAKLRRLNFTSDYVLISDYEPVGSKPSKVESLTSTLGQTSVMFQALYEMQIGKVYFQTALTGQSYHNDFVEREHNSSVNKTFINVIPSAKVSYGINSHNKITFDYFMVKPVPSANSMNPFVITTTPGVAMYGNPDLSPETINNFRLDYSFSKGAWYLQLTSANRVSRNLMLDYNFMQGSTLHQTIGNIADRLECSVSAYLTSRAIKHLYISLFCSANYVDYQAHKGFEGGNKGWYVNFQANANYNFLKEWYLSARGGYNSDKIYFQSNGGRYFYYQLALSKDFFSERLGVSLSMRNFFHINHKRTYDYFADNYRQFYSSKTFNGTFELSLTWRFGKLKANVKGGSIISNQDIKNNYSE